MSIILGIETSCDETSAAILEIRNLKLKIISNIVSSQVKTHAKYGGIVPEMAARKHAENIIPVIDEALKNIKNPKRDIDAIGVTVGPGLITSLRVGVDAARTLSYIWKKPLIGVNHVIAHIYANWLSSTRINADSNTDLRGIEFPALCLVVSGGHTMLILMKGHGKFKIIGQTLDDAAGECFDKTAKILGLGYPGGPAIAAAAAKLPITNYQLPITLPRPMINSNDFNFSFSGLKTAVLYKMRDKKSASSGVDANLSAAALTKTESARRFSASITNQMAAEIQNAIIDVLVSKTIRAAKKYNVKTIMLGGGVAANQELRKRFLSVIPTSSSVIPSEARNLAGAQRTTREHDNQQPRLLMPNPSFCADNAAMVAVAAYFNPKKIRWDKIKPNPNLTI